MLQIKNLTITHRKDLRMILENFQLTLNSGDKAVIIGEEGNGKSTLIKWIYQPELAEEYTECVGERICTKEKMGYLPQELPDTECSKTAVSYTYLEQMNNLFETYGFYKEDLCTITLKGQNGAKQIAAIMEKIRKEVPTELGGSEVLALRDYEPVSYTHLDVYKRQRLLCKRQQYCSYTD